MKNKKKWVDIQEQLKLVCEDNYSIWLLPLQGLIIDKTLYLACPNDFVKNGVIDQFHLKINEVAKKFDIEAIGYFVGHIDENFNRESKDIVLIQDIKAKTFTEVKNEFAHISQPQVLLPNSLVRNSLFGMTKKGVRKKFINERISSFKNMEIIYTGEQLDQADLDVLLVITKIFFQNNNHFNDYENISTIEVINALKIKRTGHAYSMINERIKRLVKTTLEIVYIDKNNKRSKEIITHLLMSYEKNSDGDNAKFSMHINMVNLLKDSTIINMIDRLNLGNDQLSKWIHAHYSTHATPYPIKLETIRSLCGSTAEIRRFKSEVKKRLELISFNNFILKIEGEWLIPIYKNSKLFIEYEKKAAMAIIDQYLEHLNEIERTHGI
jgi:hypothetical protein